MNRTASTRAFALNPCPADPLGRQMVYMHMSSHYRRMYSAQSVVDSAAPSKRRTPKTPRNAAGEAPSIGTPALGLAGRTLPPNFSMLKQGVTTKNNVRYFSFSSPPPKNPQRNRCAAVHEHPEALLSHNLPLVGTRRPILSVGSASAPSPEPRRCSSPTSSQMSPRNARVNSSDTGRNVRSKQSMRGDEGYTGVKPPQRSKLRERPGTYLAKLNQLAKGSIHFGSIQPTEGSVPLKPRMLPLNVQSKLRNSAVYHPPRPRPSNRAKLEERSKDGKQPFETPRSKVQSSPPGSSRDSAYNGGVSSGGESHLRARELELKKKRRAWTSGLPQSGTADDLRPLGTPEGAIGDGTIGDGGLVGSPAYSCFSSIVSSHGGTSDVGTNVENRKHSDSFNEDIESQIEGESHLGGTSAFGDESPIEEIQVDVASQTEASSNSFEEDEGSSRSPTSDLLTEFAPEKNGVDQVTQVGDFLSSAKASPVHTSNATTSTGSLQKTTSVAISAASVAATKAQHAQSVGTLTSDQSDVGAPDNSRWPDTAYVRLFHAFTSDAVKRGVLTNKALRAIFHEHVEAYKHTLDMDRMLLEWDKFRLDLNIPKEEHEQTANYGLGNVTLNRTNYLSPLTSQPSEIWSESNYQTPGTDLFLPYSYQTADVATAMSSQLDDFDTELIKTIESDINKVFDPIGIMGSLRVVPSHASPQYKGKDHVYGTVGQDPVPEGVEPVPVPRKIEQRPVSGSVEPVPVPRRPEHNLFPGSVEQDPPPERVEKASSPFREPVYEQPCKDVKCVCKKTVCTCTSTEKIVGHFDSWLQSSILHIDHVDEVLRRHSIPETKKPSENFGTHTPRVERTSPISEINKNTPPILPRTKTPVPSPEHHTKIVSPKRTVRIPRDAQNRMREKTVVCLYDPQQTFTSNDSVNEGIFGRDSGIMSVQTAFATIPDKSPSSEATTKTQNAMSSLMTDPLLDFPGLNISLTSNTYAPSPTYEFNEPLSETALKQHPNILNWLNDNSKTPAMN